MKSLDTIFLVSFFAKFDFSCVCLQVIDSAGAVAQLKLTVKVMIYFF